jgi:predicted trehalose synthase
LVVRSAPRTRFELFDAAEDPAMAAALVSEMHADRPSAPGDPGLQVVMGDDATPLPGGNHLPRALQRVRPGSNAVFTVGDGTVLKLFRRIEAGRIPRSRCART